MTTSLVSATRIRTPIQGGLRYIPTVAFGTDLVFVTLSVFAAILGRQALPFTSSVSDAQMSATLSIAGPTMIIGWVALLFAMGAYGPQVFGAGIDEYKRTVNASLVAAAWSASPAT